MIVYYDHLISIIVAGVFIMILAAFQSTVRETSVGRTLLYTGKNQTLDLADMLERDLANVGYKTPPGENGIGTHSEGTLEGVDVTKLMEFWTDVSGLRMRVRYKLEHVETVEVDGELIPLFQLSRYENAGWSWVAAGGSAPVLTDFRIALRTDKNQPTSDLAAARALRVRLATLIAPHIEDSGYLRGMRKIRWGILMRPPRLQDYSDE